MVAHRLLRRDGIVRQQGGDDRLMLPRRHFGRIGLGAVLVERSEDLEMRVQPLDRLLDQAVAAALGDQPMEQRVRLREAGIGLLVAPDARETGRESCRESVYQYV